MGGDVGLFLAAELREARVGEAELLQLQHAENIGGKPLAAHLFLGIDNFFNLADEPRIIFRDAADFLHREAAAQRLGSPQDAVRRRVGKVRHDDILRVRAFGNLAFIETGEAGFQRAQRLLHGFGKAAAHRHRFAHRLHRGGEVARRGGEFLEREARDFRHHVIDGRLERGGRGFRHVVQHFIERIAHRQLGGDFRNREAGGLRRERRGARHARVHLDDDHAAIFRVHRELHVGAAGLHANLAQHGDAGVAHDLVFLVGQRQRRGHGDGVPRMHTHRVEILDGADDDAVVVLVAHDFHLVLFPPQHGFVDEDFGGWRGIEAGGRDLLKLFHVVGHAAACAAHRETGADDDGQADALDRRARFFHRMRQRVLRNLETDAGHRLVEQAAILRLVDGRKVRADQLDAVFFQHAGLRQFLGAVERRLAAHGGQQRVRLLLGDDLLHELRQDRLDISRIRQLRIGHDRRRVGVDENDAVAFAFKRLHRLRTGVIELTRLPDNNGPRADDENGRNVSAFGHRKVCPLK